MPDRELGLLVRLLILAFAVWRSAWRFWGHVCIRAHFDPGTTAFTNCCTPPAVGTDGAVPDRLQPMIDTRISVNPT